MNLKLALIISFLPVYGSYPAASYGDNKNVLLAPVEKYSYCTPYGEAGYSLGIVGNDWALTFRVPQESFSGNVQAKNAYFYSGPDMQKYIGKSAGPVRPAVPKTKEYTKIELARINVDIRRIKIYNKVMGPIVVVVDDFTVNNQQLHVVGRVNIVCTGPLP